jgi:fructose-1,6-bisphosphatase/inositol monophosphatase family enzyme
MRKSTAVRPAAKSVTVTRVIWQRLHFARDTRLHLNGRLAAAATVQRVRMRGSAAIDLAWFAEGRIRPALGYPASPIDAPSSCQPTLGTPP